MAYQIEEVYNSLHALKIHRCGTNVNNKYEEMSLPE